MPLNKIIKRLKAAATSKKTIKWRYISPLHLKKINIRLLRLLHKKLASHSAYRLVLYPLHFLAKQDQ